MSPDACRSCEHALALHDDEVGCKSGFATDDSCCCTYSAEEARYLMPLVCQECERPNGWLPCTPDMDGRTSHRLHASCVPAYRVRIGARSAA